MVALELSGKPVPVSTAASESYRMTVYPKPGPLSPSFVLGRIGNAVDVPDVNVILATPT